MTVKECFKVFVSVIMITLAFSVGIYSLYKETNIDLSECKIYEGIIIDRGIGTSYSSSHIGISKNVFYISLKGLDEKLGIFKIFRNYEEFFEKFNIGDTIKVYYFPNHRNNINLDLIQVEKNGQIIISKDRREKSSLIGFIVLSVFFLPILFIGYMLVKNWQEKKK